MTNAEPSSEISGLERARSSAKDLFPALRKLDNLASDRPDLTDQIRELLGQDCQKFCMESAELAKGLKSSDSEESLQTAADDLDRRIELAKQAIELEKTKQRPTAETVSAISEKKEKLTSRVEEIQQTIQNLPLSKSERRQVDRDLPRIRNQIEGLHVDDPTTEQADRALRIAEQIADRLAVLDRIIDQTRMRQAKKEISEAKKSTPKPPKPKQVNAGSSEKKARRPILSGFVDSIRQRLSRPIKPEIIKFPTEQPLAEEVKPEPIKPRPLKEEEKTPTERREHRRNEVLELIRKLAGYRIDFTRLLRRDQLTAIGRLLDSSQEEIEPPISQQTGVTLAHTRHDPLVINEEGKIGSALRILRSKLTELARSEEAAQVEINLPPTSESARNTTETAAAEEINDSTEERTKAARTPRAKIRPIRESNPATAERVAQVAAGKEKARFVENKLAQIRAERIKEKKGFGKLTAFFENFRSKKKDLSEARKLAENPEVVEAINQLTETAISRWKDISDEAKKQEMSELYNMVAERYQLDRKDKPKGKLADILIKYVGPAAIGVAFKVAFKVATGVTGPIGAMTAGLVYGGVTGYLSERKRQMETRLGYEGWKKEIDKLPSEQAKLEAMRSLVKDSNRFKRYFKGRSYEAFQFMNEYYALLPNAEGAKVAPGSFAEKVLRSANQQAKGEIYKATAKAALRSAIISGAAYELFSALGIGHGHADQEAQGSAAGEVAQQEATTAPDGITNGDAAQPGVGAPPPGGLGPDQVPPEPGYSPHPDYAAPPADQATPPAGFPGTDTDVPGAYPSPEPVPDGPDVAAPPTPDIPAITHPETSHDFAWRPESRLEINSHSGHFTEGPGHEAIVEVTDSGDASADEVAKVIAQDIQHGQTGEHFLLNHEDTLRLADELAKEIKAEHGGQEVFAHDSDVTLSAKAINAAMDRLDLHPAVLDSQDVPLDQATFGSEPIVSADASADIHPETAVDPSTGATPNADASTTTVETPSSDAAATSLEKAEALAKNVAIPIAVLTGLFIAYRSLRHGRLNTFIERVKRRWDTIDSNLKKGRVDRAASLVLVEPDEDKALAFVSNVVKSKVKLFIGNERVSIELADNKQVAYKAGAQENTVGALEFAKLLADGTIATKPKGKAKQAEKPKTEPASNLNSLSPYVEKARAGEEFTTAEVEEFKKQVSNLPLNEVNVLAKVILQAERDRSRLFYDLVTSRRANNEPLAVERDGKKHVYIQNKDGDSVVLQEGATNEKLSYADFKREFLEGKITLVEGGS